MTSQTVASRTAGAAGSAALDAVAAAAVDLAREAAVEVAQPGTVGEHLGVTVEGVRLVTHRFESKAPGYKGWTWSVVVARAPRAKVATVCEAVLLPAEEAILSPDWLPWAERVAPGDLGAHDVLAYRNDDPFLEQGYEATGEEDADRLAIWELGLGRKRVLSREGRADAARRWYEGSHGPTADAAVHATAACSTCGYFLSLAGEMRQVFGVCANEWSPSEGTVVSLDHGCGAHSETDVEPQAPEAPGFVVDDDEIDGFDFKTEDPGVAEVAAELPSGEAVATLDAVVVDEAAGVESEVTLVVETVPDPEPSPFDGDTPGAVDVPEGLVDHGNPDEVDTPGELDALESAAPVVLTPSVTTLDDDARDSGEPVTDEPVTDEPVTDEFSAAEAAAPVGAGSGAGGALEAVASSVSESAVEVAAVDDTTETSASAVDDPAAETVALTPGETDDVLAAPGEAPAEDVLGAAESATAGSATAGSTTAGSTTAGSGVAGSGTGESAAGEASAGVSSAVEPSKRPVRKRKTAAQRLREVVLGVSDPEKDPNAG